MPTDTREIMATRYFDALEARDFGGLNAVVTDGMTFEMPFPVPGMAARHEGRAAVEAFYRSALGGMRCSRIRLERVILPADQSLLVAEGRGVAETTDGLPYNNRYAWIFAFSSDGRVAALREYADPLVIMAAFGGPAIATSSDGAAS